MRFLVYILTAVVLSGCIAMGTMLPGRIYAEPNGQVLQFSIEKSRGQGKMTAYNPQTDERFTGEYSAMYVGGSSTVGMVGGKNVVLHQGPTGANGKGVLVGDKGTMIRLFLEIESGNRPTGHGTGTDQEGKRYEIFF